jgi:hypothetical protein
MDGDVPRPLSDTFHFDSSMQLGYFSSSSDPVLTPIVDEENHAIIGLARAEVSINDENDAVIGLLGSHLCFDSNCRTVKIVTLSHWRTFCFHVRALTF